MSIEIFFITAGIVIVSALVAMHGWTNSCPDCQKWFSRILDDSEEISRENGYETVTRKDQTSHGNGKSSTTTRKEQVRMTYLKHKNFYSCNKCNHNWTALSSSKFEG